MRRSLRGAVGLAAVGLLVLAALPSGAAPNAEKQLLGIHIWRTWREVLAKHGQPTRIEIGAVTSPTAGGESGATSGAPGMPGMGGGMLPGLPGAGPAIGGSGGPMGAKGRAMNMAMGMGGGMTPGMPSTSGMVPATGGMMGGGRGFPMPGGLTAPGGGGMMPGGMMSGLTMPPLGGGGLTAPMGMSGMPGAAGMLPMSGGMASGGNQAAVSEPETTWVYEKGANTNYFLFNKDGRVIQIQAFGYKGSAFTSRGLKLGDPVSAVYRLYGWPDSSTRQGDNLTLDYSTKAHAAFQLTNLRDGKGTRVVGITVALTEKSAQ